MKPASYILNKINESNYYDDDLESELDLLEDMVEMLHDISDEEILEYDYVSEGRRKGSKNKHGKCPKGKKSVGNGMCTDARLQMKTKMGRLKRRYQALQDKLSKVKGPKSRKKLDRRAKTVAKWMSKLDKKMK